MLPMDKIDWSATALGTLATPLGVLLVSAGCFRGRARNFVLSWFQGRTLPETAAVSGVLAVTVVSVVALHDEDGWFGQSTAAWIQAIGSIAAIAAAVWIDQGTARRQATAREAEGRAAIGARLDAVMNCVMCLEQLAGLLREWEPEPNHTWSITPVGFEEAMSAEEVLRFYLQHQGTEIDALLVATMARAHQTMQSVTGRFKASMPIRGAGQKVAGLEILESGIGKLRALGDAYDAVRD
jgi:hypothetical protein